MKWFFPSLLINRNCCLNNGSELWPIIRMFSFLSHPHSGPYTAKNNTGSNTTTCMSKTLYVISFGVKKNMFCFPFIFQEHVNT